MSKIAEILGAGIGEILTGAKGIVTTFVKDKGLEQQINAEMERSAAEIKLKHLDYAEKALQAEVDDRANAREMYKASIISDDIFVRRFPMMLAADTKKHKGNN